MGDSVPCPWPGVSHYLQTFYLTNAGNVPLTWSLINTSLWLNVSTTGSTLAPGARQLRGGESEYGGEQFDLGTYSANLWFTNLTSGVAHARFFSLAVTKSLVQNGGFETSDFTDWTLFGDGIIGNEILDAVESPFGPDHFSVAHSGTYGALLGDSPMAILQQTLPTVPGQKYLISFWLNNPVAGAPTLNHMEQFEVNWNTNAITNTVYYVQNPPLLAGPTSILCSRAPAPTPRFNSAPKTNPISLAWMILAPSLFLRLHSPLSSQPPTALPSLGTHSQTWVILSNTRLISCRRTG